MRIPRKTRAFTMIELLIVALIFTLIAILIWTFFIQTVGYGAKLTDKTDLQRRARMAATRLTRELQQAVEILCPPEAEETATGETSPLLVFLTYKNDLVAVFVNQRRQLVWLNRTDDDSEIILAENVETFRVFRRDRRLVNFHLHLETKDKVNRSKMEQFNLIGAATARNYYN